LESLKSIYQDVDQLVEREVQQLSSSRRLIVGGFSMGGTLAMHIGYKLNQNIGGVFAMSSFLNSNSIVYEALRNKEFELPKLLQYHGERDTLVPLSWGMQTHEELKKLGVIGEFHPLKNTLHEMKKNELLELEKWLEKMLPALEHDK
jgi:phospholipase/carboxylesterase